MNSGVFPVRDYDLAATLGSGQAFRWRARGDAWVGVIGQNWVRLRSTNDLLIAESTTEATNWNWLADYLQIELDLGAVLASFPDDEPMRCAVQACRGLRLLRQEPWECLASFILSSTKQIVQIQQIVGLLCERYGDPLPVPEGHPAARAFPSAARLAGVGEGELRDCKMGFRSAYIRESAQAIASGQVTLAALGKMSATQARAELMQLSGVGPKIADCVLLFAYGFQNAFPVDVWVMKALRQLYFPRRRPSPRRLRHFTENYFGAHAGYAQQYLFHYMRTRRRA